MEEEILNAINKAIDDAMREFLDAPDTIFNNKREQLIYKFSAINELKNWKKNKTCVIKGCSNKSIENSHTIQKSGLIKQISVNGHVLFPSLNSNTGEMEMVKVGINEASTFPGYCSTHESIFHSFERTKDFKNGEHLGLQLYRTVCREIVINENHLKELETLVVRYKDFRNKKIRESIINKLDSKIVNTPTLKIGSFEIKNDDYRLKEVNKFKKEITRYLNDFLYKYQDAVLADLKGRNFSRIAYVAISFDREIPVALAGRGNFYLKERGVEVILNVLPLEDKTFIFISTLKEFETELKCYMKQFVNPLQIVSAVESWMIHGSDHWFIKPSIWQAIDSKYQKIILNQILDDNYNIGNNLNWTIFNDLKLESIKLMETNYEKLNSLLIQLLDNEKRKLTLTPTE
jgi:hypothetical protein